MFDKEMPGPIAGGGTLPGGAKQAADQTEGPLATQDIGRCIFQLMGVPSVWGELVGWTGKVTAKLRICYLD